MANLDISLTVLLVITAVLLFAAMVLSSIASAAAVDCKCKDPTAHNYSMYTAILCGLSATVIAFVLVMYIYREEIVTGVGKGLSSAGTGLQSKFKIE